MVKQEVTMVKTKNRMQKYISLFEKTKNYFQLHVKTEKQCAETEDCMPKRKINLQNRKLHGKTGILCDKTEKQYGKAEKQHDETGKLYGKTESSIIKR